MNGLKAPFETPESPAARPQAAVDPAQAACREPGSAEIARPSGRGPGASDRGPGGNRRISSANRRHSHRVRTDSQWKSARTQWKLPGTQWEWADFQCKSRPIQWKSAEIHCKSLRTQWELADFHCKSGRTQWKSARTQCKSADFHWKSAALPSGIATGPARRRTAGWTSSGTDPPARAAVSPSSLDVNGVNGVQTVRRSEVAAKGFALSDRVSRWDLLLTNLKGHLDEFPHLAEDIAALEGFYNDARAGLSRGDDLRSQWRENTSAVQAIVTQGDRVRSRMGATLQGKYGFTSEKLIKFGFNPRPVNRRRRTTAKAPAAKAQETAQDQPAPEPEAPQS